MARHVPFSIRNILGKVLGKQWVVLLEIKSVSWNNKVYYSKKCILCLHIFIYEPIILIFGYYKFSFIQKDLLVFKLLRDLNYYKISFLALSKIGEIKDDTCIKRT